MGVAESKYTCISQDNKCSYTTPITYKEYMKIKTGKNADEIMKNMCGEKEGQIMQCCDPYDKNAKELVTNNYNKRIKTIIDENGQTISYMTCKCSDNQCTNCDGFRNPTKYELCKNRTINPENIKQISDNITMIEASNTYNDCYSPCV